jgi:hypothetical protein
VHGFFQSRDFRESLEEFIEKAKKNLTYDLLIEAKDLRPNQIFIDRNSIEVVAKRLIVLEGGIERKSKPEPTTA